MRRWRVQVTPTPGPGTTPHLDDLRISGAGPHPLLHLCLCLPCVRAWLCPLNTVHVLGLFSLIGLCCQFPFQWQWVCITSCGILFSMQEAKPSEVYTACLGIMLLVILIFSITGTHWEPPSDSDGGSHTTVLLWSVERIRQYEAFSKERNFLSEICQN